MTDTAAALHAFHPTIAAWFSDTYPQPTDVQTQSWPLIAARRHALITAPTGSGKTLTAFLWALDAFATGRYQPQATRVLYISPLKALNNDIQRNLLEPLQALRTRFAQTGETFPDIRIQVRSGDSSSTERQRMLRRPPEILLTTPESLQLLLTTVRGRSALAHVETVILDEIHAVTDNRRGTVLMTALERLVRVAGDIQRIALSATVNPLPRIAAFVAGRDADGQPRPIDIVVGGDKKQIRFNVAFPAHVRAALDSGQKIWEPLTETFRGMIDANRATLFFANSRRLTEKLALAINHEQREPLVYAHHGSLARDIRAEVETRLKSGAMRAIIATNSLEMGIDIGSIDEVVLIQSPPSITAAMQRVGRAGHRVGQISRGTLFPTHAHDFLEAAALASCIEDRELEPLAPIENALDVLAQVIVSMTASETWDVDELYGVLRRSFSYQALPRDQFELVVEMLAGRYAGSRVRDLKPRVVFDRIENTLRAAKGAVYALYNAGGTIPDRGYYHLRHADTGSLVGDLDEEFVWEAAVGQVFAFGAQQWQIKRITHNDVLATPARAASQATPFWRAEAYARSFFYSERIGGFLERAEDVLSCCRAPELHASLMTQHGFEAAAASELCDYLQRQRADTGAALPHRHHLLIEYIHSGLGGYKGPDDERQIVLHTGWGGRVNRPYALALSAAWENRYGETPEMHVANDTIVVQTKLEPDLAGVTDLVRSAQLNALLRDALERSGFFGARFRECAGRALLVTRARFNQRMPLWMSRLHAKKLLTTVKQYADFPVLLETYRTCLVDEFDLPSLAILMNELDTGLISVSHVTSATPSPFAANVAWGQISRYMYADDAPESGTPSALSDDLIRAAVFDAELRPRIDATTVDAFVAKRQRTAPGYAPTDTDDLGEWLKERVMIAHDQWRALDPLDAVRVVWLSRAQQRWAVHPEAARVVATELFSQAGDAFIDVGDPRDTAALLAEVLSFHGALPRDAIAALFPLAAVDLDVLLAQLVDASVLIAGPLLSTDETLHYCDAENLEILLRMQRAARRQDLQPRAITHLPGYLAGWQHFGRNATPGALLESLDRLRGFSADVEVWLNDLVEARHPDLDTRALDELFALEGFVWLGQGSRVITVMPADDLALIEVAGSDPSPVRQAFKDPAGRYSFFQLADAAAQPAAAFGTILWDAAWAGAVSTDSFAALRAASLRNFQIDGADTPPPQAAQRHRSGARRARVASRGWPGNWRLLQPQSQSPEPDPLRALETAKDRARVLLDRYGFVCREIANREGEPFRWAPMFRALRVMELSGEITAGAFFCGLSGPQFALPAAIRQMQRGAHDGDFWIHATDPVSPAGLGIDWPGMALPHRRTGNYLAFHQGTLVLRVENHGRRLDFAADLDAQAFSCATTLLTHLLRKRRKIAVDAIDGGVPAESPLLMRLADVFDVARDHRGIELMFPAQRIG